MTTKYLYLVAAFILLNFCVSAFVLYGRLAHRRPEPAPAAEAPDTSVKHTLYVGLNDRETLTRLIPVAEAETRLNAIALKHAGGFTVFRAKGFWLNDDGLPTSEDTLVYEFVGASESAVDAIVAEMLVAMNQDSILVETGTVRGNFRSRRDVPKGE